MDANSRQSLLTELGSSQWGLFTSAQAIREGVSRTQLMRMVKDGRIEPLCYGTYRQMAGEETSHSEVKAAWLSLFPRKMAYERLKERPFDAVVIGRTAAVLQGDEDFYETPYMFAVPDGKRTIRNDIELRPWTIDLEDIDMIDGLPVASIERTIADLIRLDEDLSHVGNFITNACRRGHVVNKKRLSKLLAPLAYRNGFKKDNGESFAESLIAEYAKHPQIAHSLELIEEVVSSLSFDQEAVEYFVVGLQKMPKIAGEDNE